MRMTLTAALVLTGVVAASAAFAQDPKVTAGAAVYKQNCEVCHGENLEPTGFSFDLLELKADEHPRFIKSVTEGKGEMPAWGGQLTDAQMEEIWAYIRSKSKN